MDIEYLKILFPSLVAVLIAIGSHQLAVFRTLSEYRRKQRTEYLIAAFKALMINSNNPNVHEAITALRDAAILIQFLGSKSQAKMMSDVAEAMINAETASLDPLLASLRDDIRRELHIEKIDTKIFWLHPRTDASSQ
jgi:hypothetical protein